MQRNPPAARSLRTQKRRPNEFMAAELISCTIKVLRFFPCNTSGFMKLTEPLTVSVGVPGFCKRTDLGAQKWHTRRHNQHIPDPLIQGYIRYCLSGDEVRGPGPGWQQLSANRRLWSNGLDCSARALRGWRASCTWPKPEVNTGRLWYTALLTL